MMKKLLLGIVASWLAFVPAANATNVNIDGLPAAASVTGTSNLFECEQSGTNNQCTSAQIAAYVYGLMSGDATASGTGGLTLATVNPNVGSFGSATQCTAFTTNGKGLITAASQTTCTPAIASVTGLGTGVATALAIAPGTTGSFTTQDGSIVTGNCLKWGPGIQDAGAACGTGGSTGANPTATAGPSAVNGSATTFMRSDGAPAIQLGTGSVPGLVQCGLGLTCTAGVANASVTQRNNTTTSDTLIASDAGTVVTENNASAVAVAIAQAGTTGFASGQYWTVKNKGAGVVTITPTTSTIDGAATLTLSQNQSVDIYSDGTSYWTLPGKPVGATLTIASGTAALNTSAIASGACATVVTVSATGVATTDTVMFSYNGDPTAVTGYGASATGAVLSIYPYPTANNVNVKVCNSTAGSITPGSMTLNFRVVR